MKETAANLADGRRIWGDRVEIDYADTLDFFEGRAAQAPRPDSLTTVLYQDSHPEVAAARHEFEVDRIRPLLGLERRPAVLDVGCGNGRWGRSLSGQVSAYLGIDFSPGLIEQAFASMAGYPDRERFVFQVLGAVDLGREELALSPPFDVVLIAGVLLYLNDHDVERLVSVLPRLVAPKSVVYVREPVTLRGRLTLAAFESEELAAPYSAVYRPASFYRSRLERELATRGFRFVADEPIASELRNRAETTQHYFVLQRSV